MDPCLHTASMFLKVLYLLLHRPWSLCAMDAADCPCITSIDGKFPIYCYCILCENLPRKRLSMLSSWRILDMREAVKIRNPKIQVNGNHTYILLCTLCLSSPLTSTSPPPSSLRSIKDRRNMPTQKYHPFLFDIFQYLSFLKDL